MADWDDEEFEPEVPAKGAAAPRTDKWEGEDEDDDVKDAWDADSDEEKKEDKKEDTGEKAVQKKKKKKLADILAEKEEAKMRELESQQAELDDMEYKNTPEGKLAEKIRLQKLEESRELELAKEMMGISSADTSGLNFKPQSQEDFDSLRTGLVDKLNELQSDPLYLDFAVTLISNLCMNLNVASLKKVKSEAEAYHSAKLKEEKAAKAKGAKGKGGRATIKMETDRSMFGRGMDDGYNDMDDFM